MFGRGIATAKNIKRMEDEKVNNIGDIWTKQSEFVN